MKSTSYLNSINQSYPHRTSVHSHLQQTAYHYNSILNAKPQIDSSEPNQKIYFKAINNKHSNKIKAERLSENKKLLKSLIDIQRNYSLYGVKNQNQNDRIGQANISLQLKSKRSSHSKTSVTQKHNTFVKINTLKNPFIQKMNSLKISEENSKLYNKIITVSSSVSETNELKQWNQKIKFYSSFLDTNREKQSSEGVKHQFYSTFAKLRTQNSPIKQTIKMQTSYLLINPQILLAKSMQSELLYQNSLQLSKHSKRLIAQPIAEFNSQSMGLKMKKRKKRCVKKLKKIIDPSQTQEISLLRDRDNVSQSQQY